MFGSLKEALYGFLGRSNDAAVTESDSPRRSISDGAVEALRTRPLQIHPVSPPHFSIGSSDLAPPAGLVREAMGPLSPEAMLHRLTYEALMLVIPIFAGSYAFSFLLVLARTCAVSEGRKLWTRQRMVYAVCAVGALVSVYFHWVVAYTGTLLADVHRVLGVG